MPTSDTISFPDFDPVTGQPTFDGFTGDFDPGLITQKAEPGFAESDQVQFGGGSLAPPVVLKCERVVNPAGRPAGEYLAFSFFCSFDMAFNDQDVIVIALKSAGGSAQSDTRRIDIYPVRNGIGAGQAADPETDLDPGLPGNFHVRIDYEPRHGDVWKGNPAWTGPADMVNKRWLAAAVPNIYARCCSWQPAAPSATTTSAVSASGTFSIPVDATAGFPQSGVLMVQVGGNPALVSYASKTATSFDGCTSTASGSIPNGTTISLSDVGWSIEVLVPRTAVLGGGDWVDLNDGFGLYANIIRWGTEPGAGPHIHAGNHATQYMFPVPELGAIRHNITGSLHDNTDIPLTWYGTALVPALQSPPGSNLGTGVRFHNMTTPELSVGVRDKNLAAWSALGTSIQGASGTFDNRLVAQIRNTDAVAASGVTAEFRFANWGLPPASFPAWASAIGAAAPSVVNLTGVGGANDQDEVTAVWDRSNVPPGIAAHAHQCIWVQLRTTGGPTVHFVQGGVRRNMNFVNLTEHEEEIEISGDGYQGGGSGDMEFVLFPHVRELLMRRDDDGDDDDATRRAVIGDDRETVKKVWIWLVDAFRRTDETITIGGQTAEILDPSPGQFGAVAMHDKADDALGYRIFGKALEWQGGGYLSAKVPKGGSIKGTIQLHAGPPLEVAKTEEADRRTPRKSGCLPWLLGLLAALIAFFRKLFK
jgi:hypothetical protein